MVVPPRLRRRQSSREELQPFEEPWKGHISPGMLRHMSHVDMLRCFPGLLAVFCLHRTITCLTKKLCADCADSFGGQILAQKQTKTNVVSNICNVGKRHDDPRPFDFSDSPFPATSTVYGCLGHCGLGDHRRMDGLESAPGGRREL